VTPSIQTSDSASMVPSHWAPAPQAPPMHFNSFTSPWVPAVAHNEVTAAFRLHWTFTTVTYG